MRTSDLLANILAFDLTAAATDLKLEYERYIKKLQAVCAMTEEEAINKANEIVAQCNAGVDVLNEMKARGIDTEDESSMEIFAEEMKKRGFE
jgi:hypothetical protein